MRRAGITLLEILVSGALFLLALGVCGELAIVGIRSRNQSMNKNGEFRANLTLVHQLQVDLKEVRGIYSPDLSDLAAHRPGVDSASLVLRLPAPDGSPRVVGWNLVESQLQRTIYRPDFNPAAPASHIPQPDERVLTTNGIGHFSLQLEPPGQHYGATLVRSEIECSKPVLQRIVMTQRLEL